MPVKFTTTSRRKDLRDPESQMLYYANAKSIGKADREVISKIIADISTMSVVDTDASISAFLKVVPEQLANGMIVELGDFGSFRLSLSSEASETPEDVTAEKITGARVIFTPGRRFKEVLNNIRYQKEE